MFKVVIDTNALIDASGDDYNYSNRIIDAVLDGNIEAFANRETLRENKFISPQKVSDENYMSKLQYFFDAIKPVQSNHSLNVVADDRQDNKILASAIEANASFLITSDKHLLRLEEYKGVRIVRPEEFWHIYEEESGSGWAKWMKDFIN